MVNTGGMCCTTTMPGILGGRAGKISFNARVPPVDDPMATNLLVVCTREDSFVANVGFGIAQLAPAIRYGILLMMPF